jgi:hypothetical protein
MIRQFQDAITPTKGSSLARVFSRLGWLGFWIQVVCGSVPVILMLYYFVFSRSERPGLRFLEYLTIANLAILAFTALWSFRYTRLARRIADPERRPAHRSVLNTVWTGVVAGSIGMFFSMIVLLFEAANLLFKLLKAPQGGMPVIQTAGADSPYWIATVDMVNLVALTIILFCEFLVLAFALWLLFRTTFGSAEYPNAVEL